MYVLLLLFLMSIQSTLKIYLFFLLTKANQSLRQGKGLTREDVQLLMHSYDEELPEPERKQLASRVEVLLKV